MLLESWELWFDSFDSSWFSSWSSWTTGENQKLKRNAHLSSTHEMNRHHCWIVWVRRFGKGRFLVEIFVDFESQSVEISQNLVKILLLMKIRSISTPIGFSSLIYSFVLWFLFLSVWLLLLRASIASWGGLCSLHLSSVFSISQEDAVKPLGPFWALSSSLVGLFEAVIVAIFPKRHA